VSVPAQLLCAVLWEGNTGRGGRLWLESHSGAAGGQSDQPVTERLLDRIPELTRYKSVVLPLNKAVNLLFLGHHCK
jgi:hypothetical protein